jgi:hypothetical protein
MTISELNTKLLKGIKRAIKNAGGGISYAEARQAMGVVGRDITLANNTILEFIASGQLNRTWDEQGNSWIY